MGWWGSVVAGVVMAFLSASVAVAVPSPESTLDGLTGEIGDRTITAVAVHRDVADLAPYGYGGWWFPAFSIDTPLTNLPTETGARDGLPAWVAAFNHTAGPADPGCADADAVARGCIPTYAFRTFSQDGPARASGGQPGWARVRLPSGEEGRTGAIVDRHTAANVNNTINRIQLLDGTPSSFFIGVVIDTTARQHDPDRLEVRGNVGLLDVPPEVSDPQVEPTFADPIDFTANGRPDIVVFRVDGFTSGDYLKLRLRGGSNGASFAGLLFSA